MRLPYNTQHATYTWHTTCNSCLTDRLRACEPPLPPAPCTLNPKPTAAAHPGAQPRTYFALSAGPWGSMSTIVAGVRCESIAFPAETHRSCFGFGGSLSIGRSVWRAVLFIQHHKALPQNLAKLLLCAILSDTLNLRSVRTHHPNRAWVAAGALEPRPLPCAAGRARLRPRTR